MGTFERQGALSALDSWPAVTIDDYREAVETLLRVVRMKGTSGSRAASILLLSLYNGSEWRMDLTDLCLLSDEYYAAALNAIRGRKELMVEPHRMVAGGDEIFSELWTRWERLKVANAWKESCCECCGSGVESDGNGNRVGICPSCRGRGYKDPIEGLREGLKKIIEFDPKGKSDPIDSLKHLAKFYLFDHDLR